MELCSSLLIQYPLPEALTGTSPHAAGRQRQAPNRWEFNCAAQHAPLAQDRLNATSTCCRMACRVAFDVSVVTPLTECAARAIFPFRP
jgi:hypothetical protein